MGNCETSWAIEMTYFQLLLAGCGITVTFTQGSLFRWFHGRGEFFRCSLCCGWYAGAAVSVTGVLIEAISWQETVTLPPATALLAHLAAQFASACWRVSAEPVPDIPTQNPEISESQDLQK